MLHHKNKIFWKTINLLHPKNKRSKNKFQLKVINPLRYQVLAVANMRLIIIFNSSTPSLLTPKSVNNYSRASHKNLLRLLEHPLINKHEI